MNKILEYITRIPRLSIKKGLQIGTVLILLWVLGSWALLNQSNQIIFNPAPSLASVPETGLYDTYWHKSSEGLNFSIRRYQSTVSDKVILYLHGNTGRLTNFFPNLTSVGTVYSPSYAGFGESEGKPSMENAYDTALKTYDYLVNNLKIDEKKIIIFGHSLGGSIAIHTAKERPNASKLVVINTFSSIQSMCFKTYSIFCAFSNNVFNSAENAKSVTMPVREFVYQGDKTVPYEEGIKLYKYFTKSSNLKLIEQTRYTHSYPDWDLVLKEL
jgi:uncharacterized protein